MDEITKNKLQKKIEKDGGDTDFAITLEKIIEEEKKMAEYSKKEHFFVETLVIAFSMFSSIAAAASAVDISVFGETIAAAAAPCLKIIAVIFPAIVSALVAYRGIKKSLETWLRHRKYDLELNLLINEYIYGSRNFHHLKGKKAYLEFRNKVQGLYQRSKQDFFTNMNK